jgi:hypothetical protein
MGHAKNCGHDLAEAEGRGERLLCDGTNALLQGRQ